MACQRAGVAWLEPLVGVGGGLGDRFGTRSSGPSADNGGHDRLHRDIAEELECFGQGATAEALEMRCPAELYRDSAKRYSGAIRPYPDEYVTAWN
jgi:hypothetical protein